MELILTETVEGLGAEGDVVRVAEGYARNYLLPRKLAAPVTEATRRRLETRRKAREAQQQKELEQARVQAAAIEQASCTLTAKTGEGGKLFGSITSADIAAALKAQGLELDKRQIELPEPLRELGVFNVPVKVHPEVQATLKVWIVEE
ncbi:MAG: 50S ribosomal protein L9 [Kiritimatiellae bacterium]|nr:50S ribosomal protein L9 [Kiritimatiellia bacterium]